MRRELPQRRARLLESFRELEIDCILISALPNVRYLSGYTGSNGLMVLSQASATLFTDPRYAIQARNESDCAVKVQRGSLFQAAAKWIERKRWKRLGFERNRARFGDFAELQENLPAGWSLHPTTGVVERLRMVKSDAEAALIRESVKTNSAAYDRAIRRINGNTTESGLAAELEYQMRKLGAERPAFETIVASAARSALPHANPSNTVIVSNQLLLIDMGAMQGGYASDMTRVLHVGKPTTKARKLYNAVLEAQLAAVDAVRPGVTAGAVDRKARQVLRSHGLDKAFVHSTGHGLGLEIHEPPRLGKKDQTVLEAGMAITIEPGAYVEGFGGVRIEDTVLVTHNGCDVLTPTPKELIIL